MDGPAIALLHCVPHLMTSGRGRQLDKPGEFKSRTEGYMNPMGNDFKVLVVDDSPVSRKLVELPLAQKRYKLIFAKTGQEAMKLFERHRNMGRHPTEWGCQA